MMDYKPGDRVACGQLRADASVADQGVVMENLEQSASLMSRLAGVHTDSVCVLGSVHYYSRLERVPRPCTSSCREVCGRFTFIE